MNVPITLHDHQSIDNGDRKLLCSLYFGVGRNDFREASSQFSLQKLLINLINSACNREPRQATSSS